MRFPPSRSLPLLLVVLLAPACATSGQMSANGVARLESARAARPNDAAVARSLGIAYYKQGKFAEARTHLNEAVRLNPRDGAATLYLGLTAERQNDLAGARAAYQTYQRYGRTSRVRRQLEARLAAITRQELALAAKNAVAREQQISAQPASPRTVAVMPLRFVGVDSSLKPLERGLAELITIDLARSSQLTVVERARLQALLDEIALQQSGQTDAATNVRAGKMIQAGRIVSGQIVQDQQRLRVDAAIVNTQTSGLQGGAVNENTIDQLFTIQKNIVLQLFDSLGVRLTTAERNAIEQRPTRSLQAFLAYSRGLQFEDQGRYNDAARSFGDAARIDPSFGIAAQKSADNQAAAQGATLTPVALEASVAGTPEGAVAQQSAQGGAPGSGNNSDNSARNMAEGLNPSQAGNATTGATTGGGVRPEKDPLSSATGQETRASSARVVIVVRIPNN
ncbi:MAG TPA: tetratricopeptide repeat protein [Gemmatimonadaceae bacterium]|nr:tetratricopeptide repeat protein [Gemmatimonadaceae bacterium]